MFQNQLQFNSCQSCLMWSYVLCLLRFISISILSLTINNENITVIIIIHQILQIHTVLISNASSFANKINKRSKFMGVILHTIMAIQIIIESMQSYIDSTTKLLSTLYWISMMCIRNLHFNAQRYQYCKNHVFMIYNRLRWKFNDNDDSVIIVMKIAQSLLLSWF